MINTFRFRSAKMTHNSFITAIYQKNNFILQKPQTYENQI